jgi:hypothetical protein
VTVAVPEALPGENMNKKCSRGYFLGSSTVDPQTVMPKVLSGTHFKKRLTMKRLISPMIAIVAFASMLILFTVPKRVLPKVQADDADEVCTLATLNGPYGFVLTGTVVNFGPIAIVGVATYDGAGGIVADQTASINGNVVPEHNVGTYTVNSDCTGSSKVSPLGGPEHNANFVILDKGRELQLLVTDHGVVVNGTFKKMFPGHGHDKN